MKYIVLYSNGPFEHDFDLFETIEEANECFNRARERTFWQNIQVRELVKDAWF